jgi:hypothetical protein
MSAKRGAQKEDHVRFHIKCKDSPLLYVHDLNSLYERMSAVHCTASLEVLLRRTLLTSYCIRFTYNYEDMAKKSMGVISSLMDGGSGREEKNDSKWLPSAVLHASWTYKRSAVLHGSRT